MTVTNQSTMTLPIAQARARVIATATMDAVDDQTEWVQINGPFSIEATGAATSASVAILRSLQETTGTNAPEIAWISGAPSTTGLSMVVGNVGIAWVAAKVQAVDGGEINVIISGERAANV